MKKLLYTIFAIGAAQFTFAQQQNYCDFEGIKFLKFGPSTGVLDSMIANPAPDVVNGSANCARYLRDTAQYDFIKLFMDTTLVDVTPYANNTFQTPKMKLKVFSTAPIGTPIILQLGIRSVDNYPAGIHSEYIGVTGAQNSWEVVTFNYFQSPSGSLAGPTSIDKIVLLFDANSNNRDTIYFDDLTGPPLVTTAGISSVDPAPSFRLFQNSPNPAKGNTHISFQVNSSGWITLKLFDVLGNPVMTLVDQNMKAGSYSIPLETADVPEGIYFYVLQKNGASRSMKMVVSK